MEEPPPAEPLPPLEEYSSKANGPIADRDPPNVPQGNSINNDETVLQYQFEHKENEMEEKQVTQASSPLLEQGTNPNEPQRRRSPLHHSVSNIEHPFIEWDILGDTGDTSLAATSTHPSASATMPYKVAPALMDTAKAIWDSYGDIGVNSALQSLQFRSAIFSLICKVVLEMNKIGYNSLDRKTVKKWQEEVVDAEKSGWEVGWLRQRVEEVTYNIAAAEILLEVKMKREAERAKLKQFDEEIQRYLTISSIFSKKAFELKEDKLKKAKELESKVRVPKILAKAVETVSLWGANSVGKGLLDIP
ncbi:uncharacterized protein LOC122645008 [Telopea speciosissima]|uniref:uncharacterized protein LOC122645008 n=1 Tax=Telopea speciosissima TaxID=54955 RepID=UPI001CC7C0E0|nr:uncharacterized protein LOC122645008 [Telopea speciosissima]